MFEVIKIHFLNLPYAVKIEGCQNNSAASSIVF